MTFKLGIINDWHDKKSAVFWNKDGILKMLHVLRERDGWETRFFKTHDRTFEWSHDYVDLSFSPDPVKQLLDWKPDAILGFSDFSRPYLNAIKDSGIPIALCYTGGRFTDYKDVPNIVFVESKSYVDWMKPMGINVVQAFGTNTELFKPLPNPKIFDAYFPCTGAAWKRHHLFAEAMGSRGLISGWWQPHEPECLQVCVDNKVAVLHHQMAESVAYLYNMAKTVLVTSHDTGGSQRTVLEAMACNIPVIVMADSTMTTEYVRECGQGEIVEPNVPDIQKAVERMKDTKVTTRDWILENYSEFKYADAIKAGIESICK